MARVRLDKTAVRAALRNMGEQVTDTLMAEFVTTVAREMPVEDGHAHECLASAAGQVKGPETKAVAAAIGNCSRDPTASGMGAARTLSTAAVIRTILSCALPFMAKLEYGGVIQVGDRSGNRGPKIGGASTRGVLYAPRSPQGQGWLLVDGARARSRSISPGLGFWAKGILAAKALAKSLGLKAK